MKAKDKARLNVVKSLLSEISYAEKEPANTNSSSFDVSSILQRSIKRRQDALEQYRNANATELAETESIEIAIIGEYLPKQMSTDEINAVLSDIIKQVGAQSEKDLGKVMKAVKLDAAVAPKKLVSDLAKALLKEN